MEPTRPDSQELPPYPSGYIEARIVPDFETVHPPRPGNTVNRPQAENRDYRQPPENPSNRQPEAYKVYYQPAEHTRSPQPRALADRLVAQAFAQINKLEDPGDFYTWFNTVKLIAASAQLDKFFGPDAPLTIREVGETPAQRAEMSQACLVVFESLGLKFKRDVTQRLRENHAISPHKATPIQIMDAVEDLVQQAIAGSGSPSSGFSTAPTLVE